MRSLLALGGLGPALAAGVAVDALWAVRGALPGVWAPERLYFSKFGPAGA